MSDPAMREYRKRMHNIWMKETMYLRQNKDWQTKFVA